MIRLAIYYTPAPDSMLASAAAGWLGRGIDSCACQDQPALPGIAPDRLQHITAAPFHYGFHGTIKPPFQLQSGVQISQIGARLEEFAAGYAGFFLPPLELRYMAGFFCLMPAAPCRPLEILAGETVRAFDDYRRPPGLDELQKRRTAGLTSRQEEMLSTWGYPYVLDEFRFHLTLTGRIDDPQERRVVGEELARRFPLHICSNLLFDALSLFIEIDRAPLVIVRRVPLGFPG